MKKEEQQQELIYRLRMFEQQAKNLEEQLEAVENGINELESLNFGMDELKGSVGKEILSPLGRGVFVQSNLSSENLIVDIGGKNFVKKGIPETKEIIEEQIKKLSVVKKEIDKNLEHLEEEMAKSLEDFQKMRVD